MCLWVHSGLSIEDAPRKDHLRLITVTHDPETGGINRLHIFLAPVSGTCIMQIWDPIRLQAEKWHACNWKDDIWLLADYYLHFRMFSCCNLISSYQFIIYIASIHDYFRLQKFSFLTHMLQKVGIKNLHQKMEPIYSAGFCSVFHGLKNQGELAN